METLFTVATGSTLYGTNLPGSDEDTISVVLPNLDDLLLARVSDRNKHEITGDDDRLTLTAQNFVRGFLAGRQQVMETIFASDHELCVGLRKFLHNGYVKPAIGMTLGAKDTKMKMHALRNVEQCIEMHRFHTITFPRPNAVELLKIRSGEIDPTTLIEERVAELRELEGQLPTPNEVEGRVEAFFLSFLRKQYALVA